MKNSPLNELIRDTALFFKEGYFFNSPLSMQKVELPVEEKKPLQRFQTPPKAPPQQAPPQPPLQKVEPPPTKKVAEPPMKKETLPTRAKTLLEKHLPHIEFLKTPPSPPQVAILVSNRGDLPFLKGLAKAIQSRFCPVKLLDIHVIQKKGGDSQLGKDGYTLILTQEEIPSLSDEERILLASIETYEKNTERKKELWSQICQKLSSPKLS